MTDNNGFCRPTESTNHFFREIFKNGGANGWREGCLQVAARLRGNKAAVIES
jgi:hypothetical protein